MSAVPHYDFAIAGGGPAGAAAALELARAGCSVLLVHVPPRQGSAPGESLPPNARPLLATLGVLPRVLADGHRPSYGNRSAWGNASLVDHDFIRQLHGPGLQLDRQRFDASLRDAVCETGAVLIGNARLALDPASNWSQHGRHTLLLRSPSGRSRRSCGCLIDAGGRAAVLSRQFGARRLRDDRLIALQMRLRSSRADDHDGSTLVEAVADGWWYSLLLPDGERLAVFLTDRDLLDRRRLLRSDGLEQMLQRTMHLRALLARHDYLPRGRVHGHEACSSRLDSACGPGWLAVGDAAMAFDPLASRGISSALHSGQTGAHALLAQRRGDAAALAQWQRGQADIHRVYRAQLAQVYGAERRWLDCEFWQRRVLRPSAAQALDAVSV